MSCNPSTESSMSLRFNIVDELSDKTKSPFEENYKRGQFLTRKDKR